MIHIFFFWKLKPDLINVYGYASETHNVVTEDGYILKVHRISNPGKQPALLMHGVLDCSASWIMLGPKQAFGMKEFNLFRTWFSTLFENWKVFNCLIWATMSGW